VVQYAYYPTSADERLQSITNLAPGTSGTLSQFSYGYNPAGDITSWVQQSGTSTAAYQYGYDGADQLLRATATGAGSISPIDAYAYQYDPAGNRTVEQIGTAVTSSTYNDLNQMTKRGGGGLLTISGSLNKPGTVTVSGTTSVTGSGNIFSAVAPVVTGSNNITISATNANGYGVTKTLSVNVTGGTAISGITYDADGNVTYDGTWNYGWDAANRLVKIWYGPVAGSSSTAMSYDGLGRRVQIIESGSSGAVTSMKNLIWDGLTIREERNASNSVTKMYFSNGVQISGSDYYYTRDHLGSIREVTTGTSGTIAARYDYNPYGQETELSGTMQTDFGFTGQYYHQASGLLLSPYRAYSASVGRWISRDPIGERRGINLYDYVLNDPILLTDPFGLSPWSGDVTLSGGAVLGGSVDISISPSGDISITPTVGVGFGLGVGFSGNYTLGDPQGMQVSVCKAAGGGGFGGQFGGGASWNGPFMGGGLGWGLGAGVSAGFGYTFNLPSGGGGGAPYPYPSGPGYPITTGVGG
jgi:RHS repeat-associated protein